MLKTNRNLNIRDQQLKTKMDTIHTRMKYSNIDLLPYIKNYKN